jgi:putative restriction endonuclease
LVSRYFPGKQSELEIDHGDRGGETAQSEIIARSGAFRLLILKTYDHQCVACGLRIRLPNDITIVDAAHLIPFSVSANDHPTNGFALCKNHHWAFDRHLITPSHNGVWRVSRKLEARRSRGEGELVGLEGERLLLPQDEAFSPSEEAIEWRLERLLG